MTDNFSSGFRLDRKVAIVTGGAAGIGLAVAELFAAQGAHLALLDRSDGVLGVARRLPGDHLGLVVDVQDVAEIRRCVAEIRSRFGRIDVLVNNAGIARLDDADSVVEADWDATMAVNVKAPFFLAQAVAPIMAAGGGGRIVNLASQAAVVALKRHAAYCASKAALASLTQVLAVEWAPRGITVNAISPTVVETELGQRAWAGAVGEAMKAKIPVGRFAQPSEIASAVLYLASAHAAMVTGANLLVDGGYTVQ